MKTLENNKLIAEFLSVKMHPCETIENFKFLPMEERGLYNGYFIEQLKYHEDWNQLMKAIKKIDEINLNAPIIWNLEGKTNDIFISIREVNIELTYNRVIDFINFYNNQNKVS